MQIRHQNEHGKTSTFLALELKQVHQEDRLINFLPLREKIEAYIASQSGTVGVYFEYIPTGNSIGINENTAFLYASLLKVPVTMAIYEKIQLGKLSLDQKITITKDMVDLNYGDFSEKDIGKTLSVKEAIKLALVPSDNTAAELLKNLLTEDEFLKVIEYLDIPWYIDDKNQPGVTPKGYTSILRSLYFSSFLSEENSEALLSLLNEANFLEGIRKPIPTTIPVAHKFGIRASLNTLSDCGIVYLPNRPYFLCIMVSNQDNNAAKTIIQSISKYVYDYLAPPSKTSITPAD